MTERSVSPRSMASKAGSVSSSVMTRVTARSRSRSPRRYQSASMGKSRDGRQSPYQLTRRAAAQAEELLDRQVQTHRRVRHADEHACAGEVARPQGLQQGFGPANRLE